MLRPSSTNRPNPQLLSAIKDFEGQWIQNLTQLEASRVFPSMVADRTAVMLQNQSLPIWETTAFALTENGTPLTWYLAGSLPDLDPSYTVVVVLERKDAKLATLIGQRLLNEILNP